MKIENEAYRLVILSGNFCKAKIEVERSRGAEKIYGNKKVCKMTTFHTKIKGSFHDVGITSLRSEMFRLAVARST